MAEYVDCDVTLKAILLLNPKAAVSVNDDPDFKNADGEWEEQIAWSGWYRPDGEGTELVEQPQFTLEEIRAKYPEAKKAINNRTENIDKIEASAPKKEYNLRKKE